MSARMNNQKPTEYPENPLIDRIGAEVDALMKVWSCRELPKAVGETMKWVRPVPEPLDGEEEA